MGLLLLGLVLAVAFVHRRMLAVFVYAWVVEPPPLSEPAPEAAGVAWLDDYHTVLWLDPETAAIGEPRYYQQPYSYLILGEERALLFDTGAGLRDLAPVVAGLTELPVTAAPSHLHFDHVGSLPSFERVALPDLPGLRARERDGRFTPRVAEHLGFVEGYARASFAVGEWWPIGKDVDLGGRTLTVLHTPGHTPESISLLDPAHGFVFTGDFVYPGPLFAQVPGSDLGDYLRATTALLPRVGGEMRLAGGHRVAAPGEPILRPAALADLRRALLAIRDGELRGEGAFLRTYPVNDDLWILGEPAFTADWD